MRSYVLLRPKLRLLYSTVLPVAVVLINTVLRCYTIDLSAVLSMPSNYRIFRVVYRTVLNVALWCVLYYRDVGCNVSTYCIVLHAVFLERTVVCTAFHPNSKSSSKSVTGLYPSRG